MLSYSPCSRNFEAIDGHVVKCLPATKVQLEGTRRICKGTINIVIYLPTQIRFPIEGKRVTCRGSKLTNSLGNNNMNFRLASVQVVVPEATANL